MAKIQILDLPGDMSFSKEDMQKIHGGIQITVDVDDELNVLNFLKWKARTTFNSYFGSSSSSSSGGSSGRKPSNTTMESK